MSEKFPAGFVHVDELDDAGSYEFNIIGLWQKTSTGDLYWGTDSGCSCPTPWERTSESDLSVIVPATFEEFEQTVMTWKVGLEQRRDFIETARSLLKAADQHVRGLNAEGEQR